MDWECKVVVMDVAFAEVLNLLTVKVLRRLAVEHGAAYVIEGKQLHKADLISGLVAKVKGSDRLEPDAIGVVPVAAMVDIEVGSREALLKLTGVKLRRFAVARGVHVTRRDRKKPVNEIRAELADRMGLLQSNA